MLLVGLASWAEAQSDLAAALASAAMPLRTVESEADDSDLSFVCPWTEHASVVSLGEPGHGAHEPLAFRNRLFAYLVDHCGFTAIAIETSFTESRAVHDFVAGGDGNAVELVRTHLSWGLATIRKTCISSNGCERITCRTEPTDRCSFTAST